MRTCSGIDISSNYAFTAPRFAGNTFGAGQNCRPATIDDAAKPLDINPGNQAHTEHYVRASSIRAYGEDSNLGSKLFIKLNDYHKMVLNIPIWKKNPQISDLVGFDRIMATLPTIISSKYEGALLPIELAHGIASLSTYPSAKILKIFSKAHGI